MRDLVMMMLCDGVVGDEDEDEVVIGLGGMLVV